MLARVHSFTIWGIEGYPVEVEVDIAPGLPGISVVGLPDQAVKEARDRLKPAIRNSGFEFPTSKIVVNLAPADLKKEGSYFDLPIALGILKASNPQKIAPIEDFCFVGELALDGSLRPVKGILPMAIKAKEMGQTSLVLPWENAEEAALVQDISVFPVKNLGECVDLITGKTQVSPYQVDLNSLFSSRGKYEVDFSEVKGQTCAKRALEVAVSGGHNILMVGSPGAGKSMLASRIPTILPSLSLEESMEITRIHSAAGVNQGKLVTTRPFRHPHHTVSDIALIGGGNIPGPGEVSLAHNGVLFLDELPEFHRNALEALRQPMENGQVTISRAKGRITFPSRFLLVAAMNPCPCGWYGDQSHTCRCTLPQIIRYRQKISGPLLDRIDIHIEVTSLPASLLLKERQEESSDSIRQRVENARKIQAKRFEKEGIFFNAHMSPSQMRKYCSLTEEARSLLEKALSEMHFSGRAYDKIRKVARTIADLDSSETIQPHHIAEAIQYRSLDRELY
ncbi:MAG: YifB family Mg chelatase-like AAA ATPase [Candidatus Omnitrophica bacterium]|nr:YifB family Mg chelatase-like AAA ATPase [Candidatus Omnitrophota bacterium]MCM8768959.1 YifB family Mg chelatase-like AAA ATPase [Candidatus Omnitrophota bacterium]